MRRGLLARDEGVQSRGLASGPFHGPYSDLAVDAWKYGAWPGAGKCRTCTSVSRRPPLTLRYWYVSNIWNRFCDVMV